MNVPDGVQRALSGALAELDRALARTENAEVRRRLEDARGPLVRQLAARPAGELLLGGNEGADVGLRDAEGLFRRF